MPTCEEDECQAAPTWTVVSVIHDDEGRHTHEEHLCLAHLPFVLHTYETWLEDEEAQHEMNWDLKVIPWVPPVEPPPDEFCVHGLALWLCADPVYHYPPDGYPF